MALYVGRGQKVKIATSKGSCRVKYVTVGSAGDDNNDEEPLNAIDQADILATK